MTKKIIPMISPSFNLDGDSLATIEDRIKKLIVEFGPAATLEYSQRWDGDTQCRVSGHRPETDEEYELRLTNEAEALRKQEIEAAHKLATAKQQRYMQYLALRMEFGNPTETDHGRPL